MNDADSAKLAAVFESAGYTKAEQEKSADIILVNTCVVRQNAEDRAAWFIKSSKGLKKKNPSLKIGVCGCLVTEPGRDLKEMFPHVDFFIPPNSSDKLAEYLHLTFDISHLSLKDSSLVTITHGCNNYCSYCIVPYVRGREYSRPMTEVLAEIKQKIKQGAKEITLLGQNVNSFEPGLANLLKSIHSFDICHLTFVIHFMTSHPKDMSDEIIEAVHQLPYVAKEFHFPLQSGDDEILKKMNRGYTVDYYQGRIKKIRELMPKARITTDIMVGFPGETEEQFQNTLKILKQIHFSSVNMFAYSARPETAAAKMPGPLSQEIIQRRLQELIKTNRKILAC